MRVEHWEPEMSVTLNSRLEALVQRKVDEGLYADVESVVETAFELLEERDQRREWLRNELAIGEEQERRGDLIDLTPEHFAEITRQAIENARAGKPVRDAV